MYEITVTLDIGQVEAVRPLLHQGCSHDLQALIALTHDAIELGKIVLIEHPPEHYFGTGNPDYPRLTQYSSVRALADSIGKCACLPITPYEDPFPEIPEGKNFVEVSHLRKHLTLFPCLYGPAAQITRIASWLPDNMQIRVWSTIPIRLNFTKYKNLWAGEENSESMTEALIYMAEDSLAFDAYSLGRGLAAAHVSNILHGDAHQENFISNGWERAHVLDDETWRDLYRPPTPAESATDIGPLMESFSPREWRLFRWGYLHQIKMGGKVDGRLVFGIIEYGREVAWTRFGPIDNLSNSLKSIDLRIATTHDLERRLALLIQRMTLLMSMVSPVSLAEEVTSLLTKTAQILPQLFPVALINFAESCMQVGDITTAQMFLQMAVNSVSETTAGKIAASVAAGMLESIDPDNYSEPS